MSGHGFAKGLGIDKATILRMAVDSGIVKAGAFITQGNGAETIWRAQTDDDKIIEVGFSGQEKDIDEIWLGISPQSAKANDALKLFGRYVKSVQKDLPKEEPWLARFGEDVYNAVPSWILQAYFEYISAYPITLSTYVGGRVERARNGTILVIDGWERGFTRMTIAADHGRSGFRARDRELTYKLTEPVREEVRKGDFARSLELLKPLLAAGDPGAELYMAEAYHFGRGVEPNPAKAYELYQSAAKLGLARAETRLALFYSPTVSHAGDLRKQTVPWLLKASAQGDPWAMRALSGILSIEEKEKRFLLCEYSARLGSPAGQHCLAGYYQAGVDIGQDLQRAYFWSTLGMSLDGPGLRRDHFRLIHNDVAQHLKPSQIKIADDLVASWKPDKIETIKSECLKAKCPIPFK